MSFKKIGTHYDKALREWVEEFEAEYLTDVQALPKANPGSTCRVLETNRTVKMADNGVWGGGSGGGGLLIIDVDMSSMTTSLSTDEVLLAMSEGKYPVLKVPYNKNDVMYLPFVCKSINGYSFCGYVYANDEWRLIGAAVSGNKLVETAINQFSGVDIMHTGNALRIKSTDGQKTFAIVVDGDGTIRAEEAV